jgi:hypothetical protein
MQNNSRKPSYSDVVIGGGDSLGCDENVFQSKIMKRSYSDVVLESGDSMGHNQQSRRIQNIPPYRQVIHQLNQEILSNKVLGLIRGLQVLAKNQMEIEAEQKELSYLNQQMPESSVSKFQVDILSSSFKNRE